MLFASHKQTSVQTGGSIKFACDFGSNGYMQRTPSVAGDVTKWSLFTWMKRNYFSSSRGMFDAGSFGNPYRVTYWAFHNTDQMCFGQGTNANDGSGGNNFQYTTAEAYKKSEWLPALLTYDTPNNVMALQIGKDVRYEHVGLSSHCRYVNTTATHIFAGYTQKVAMPCGCSLAHSQFVDGAVCELSDFVNLSTGKHRDFAGDYGALGWHLDFSDPNNLGKDVSGNNNHWSLVNSGSIRQIADTPTTSV